MLHFCINYSLGSSQFSLGCPNDLKPYSSFLFKFTKLIKRYRFFGLIGKDPYLVIRDPYLVRDPPKKEPLLITSTFLLKQRFGS